MSSTAGCGLGSVVAFTGLESFVASIPDAAGLAAEGAPEGLPELLTGEEAEVTGLRVAGAPLLVKASEGAAFGLASKPEFAGATVFGIAVFGVAVSGAGPFSAFSGLEGTVGKRSARISAARAAPVLSGAACRWSIFVTTSTSSNLLRSAAGRRWIFRKSSLPGVTFVTVPT